MNLKFHLLFLAISAVICKDYIHSPIQYHTQTESGTYNYGYDTGLYGSHQFHQERKDNSGFVWGRYGYTDPNGKLRTVYYRSGPQGFQIIGDTESAPLKSETNINSTPNSIDISNRLKRTEYNSNYMRRGLHSSTIRSAATTRRPYLIRKYRQSNGQNSRVYLAGRDYGHENRISNTNRESVPIHRVESPLPVNNYSNRRSYTTRTSTTSPTIARNIRTMSYSALDDRTVLSLGHSPSVISSAPRLPIIRPSSTSTSLTPRNGFEINSVPLALARPLSSTPIVYSGRGILSPSAAARLRAGALRGTDTSNSS